MLAVLEKLHKDEKAAENGRAFAYTYTSQRLMGEFAATLSRAYALYSAPSGLNQPEHESLLANAWQKLMHTNALNPMMYSSLRQLENEVVAMTANMLHGDATTVVRCVVSRMIWF